MWEWEGSLRSLALHISRQFVNWSLWHSLHYISLWHSPLAVVSEGGRICSVRASVVGVLHPTSFMFLLLVPRVGFWLTTSYNQCSTSPLLLPHVSLNCLSNLQCCRFEWLALQQGEAWTFCTCHLFASFSPVFFCNFGCGTPKLTQSYNAWHFSWNPLSLYIHIILCFLSFDVPSLLQWYILSSLARTYKIVFSGVQQLFFRPSFSHSMSV